MNAKRPSLLVAVINYEGWMDTLECLSSLDQSRFGDFVAVVVDNASHDDSVERIQDKFDSVEILRSRTNRGYSGACNEAIRKARELGAAHCLVLNNDTVLDPEAMTFLVTTATAHRQAAAVGPVIMDYYSRDRILSEGGHINMRRGWSEHPGRGEHGRTAPETPLDICGYLDGSALMFVLDKIDTVGMMDERFFMYFEDSDWCYRARRLGYTLLVEPRARVWHKVGRSTRAHSVSINYWFHRNRVLFEKDYASKTDWILFWGGMPWHTFVGPQVTTSRHPVPGELERAALAPSARSVVCGLLDGLLGTNSYAKDYVIR